MHQENSSSKETSKYAVAGDFCRIFAGEMNRLYLLAFLLTGDRLKAEQCFVSGLEDCVGSNQVFREWTRSWARRAIVQNAIRIVWPSKNQTKQSSTGRSEMGSLAVAESGTALAAVAGLNAFERFVFVLSVLERYSEQDCRLLLGCSRQEVVRARSQALARIARFGDVPLAPAPSSAGETFAQAG